jgi:hypothetical protein
MNNLPITSLVTQQNLISPPKSDSIEKKRTVIYVVDSRDRNMDLYPNPSNYKIDLSDEFRDVQAIELLSIQLPEVIYTINRNNDHLNIYYGSDCKDITFPHGKYNTGASLAKCIEEGLCRGVSDTEKLFKVYYVKRLHKLVIQTKYPNPQNLLTLNLEGRQFPYGKEGRYEQLYPEKCIGEVIGFPPGVYDMSIGTAFINQVEESVVNTINNETDSEVDPTDPSITSEEIPVTNLTITYLLSSHKCFDKYFYRPLPDTEDDNDNTDNYNPLTERVKSIWLLNRNHTKHNYNGLYQVNLIQKKEFYIDNQYGWFIQSPDTIPHGEYYVYLDYIVSPNPIELVPHKYILLRIPKCHRFTSKDKSTQMSFAKIPIGNELQFLNQNGIGVLKYFKPPLPTLDTLHIQFMPYKKGCDSSNREIFDFSGGEHVLVFALVFHRQNLKYSELTT